MSDGADWYQRYLSGDEQGLVEIIRLYKDGLILYLTGIVGDVYVAEELAEDVFVKLGIKRPKDKGGGSFKTFLYTIGRRMALDHIRRQKRRCTIPLDGIPELPADAADVEAAYIAEERKALLYTAINRLSADYRQVLWLVYFEGFSHKQVAAILHKTVHSVDTLLYRARRSLKTELEKEGFDYEDL